MIGWRCTRPRRPSVLGLQFSKPAGGLTADEHNRHHPGKHLLPPEYAVIVVPRQVDYPVAVISIPLCNFQHLMIPVAVRVIEELQEDVLTYIGLTFASRYS